MADVPGVDGAYKLAALQALATGGSQAKAAIDQARTDMQASQAAALKQAAANSAAYGLGQSGTDTLSTPISGAYNAATNTLNKVSAPRLSSFETMREPTARLFDAKATVNAARGSGGGGRGGSGGGSGKQPDWFSGDVQLQYGTKPAYLKALNLDTLPTNVSRQYLIAQGATPAEASSLVPSGYNKIESQVRTDLHTQAKAGTAANKVNQHLAQQFGQGTPAYQYWVAQYASFNKPKKK